jgi:hypothetical protein
MFKIATITTAISIGPMNHVMNASADVNTLSIKQPPSSLFRNFDPFRMMMSTATQTATQLSGGGVAEPTTTDAGVAVFKQPSRTAMIVTASGAAIVLGVMAKVDDAAAKKRRQELAAYLTNKKPKQRTEELVAATTTSSKTSSATSHLRSTFGGGGSGATRINGDVITATILSTDKNVFRTGKPSTMAASSPAPASPRTAAAMTPTHQTTTTNASATTIPIVNDVSITSTNSATIINNVSPYQTKSTPPSAFFQSRPDRPDLSAKYAAIPTLEERAFQILLDLGMVEVTSSGPAAAL